MSVSCCSHVRDLLLEDDEFHYRHKHFSPKGELVYFLLNCHDVMDTNEFCKQFNTLDMVI